MDQQQVTPAERRTCSVEEAAAVLGIGRGTAYQAARSGELPALRFGRSWRVPLAELDRMAPPRSVQ